MAVDLRDTVHTAAGGTSSDNSQAQDSPQVSTLNKVNPCCEGDNACDSSIVIVMVVALVVLKAVLILV
jgi:hypothetical protein